MGRGGGQPLCKKRKQRDSFAKKENKETPSIGVKAVEDLCLARGDHPNCRTKNAPRMNGANENLSCVRVAQKGVQ